MIPSESDLDLAQRHISEALVRIENQRRLLDRLRLAGHPTDLAESLLQSLIDTEAQMVRHRDYMLNNLKRP